MEHETEPVQPEGLAASPAVEPGSDEDRTVRGSGQDRTVRGSGQDRTVPGTGEPRVDAALRLLDRLPGLPVSEHPQLFEQVHAQLTEVLGELDSAQGPQAN